MTEHISGDVCNDEGDILIDEGVEAKLGFVRINSSQLDLAEAYGWVLVGKVIGTDFVMVQRQTGWFKRLKEMKDE